MADSDFVHVNYNALSTGQNDFAAVYQALEGTLEELRGQLNASLDHWTDEAKLAYQSAQSEWDKVAAQLATVLMRLGNVIGTAHENYSGVERANARMW